MKTLFLTLIALCTACIVRAQKPAETLPVVTTTAHCASLNGKILGAQSNVKVFFMLGESLSKPMQPTTWIPLDVVTKDSAWSVDICDLKCNTQYFYEFCVYGSSETPCGNPLSFKTADTAGCVTSNVPTTATQEILIYPNPVKNYLQVSAVGANSYIVYDMFGWHLKTGKFNGYTMVNLSSFASGIYYIEVINSSGNTVVRKKLVKD